MYTLGPSGTAARSLIHDGALRSLALGCRRYIIPLYSPTDRDGKLWEDAGGCYC